MKLIQLRIKDLSSSTVIDDIIKSKTLCKSYGAQLVVNDYWQVALDQGCDFVHLGQEDMDTADFAALRRAGVRIGLSTHDDDELERADNPLKKEGVERVGPSDAETLDEVAW